MIEHVYRRVAMCKAIAGVYVATCDAEIRQAAVSFGAPVVMTASTHERASDRVAEAAQHLDAEIIVLVQGDEPMTSAEAVTASLKPFKKNSTVQCVNLTKRIESEDEFLSPNTIKVVIDRAGDALFMSRQPIPTMAKLGFAHTTAFKQVCIIPFTRRALEEYSQLSPTPLEVAESIDMLRLLEHGRKVRMIETQFESHAVDTPEDRAKVEKIMQSDSLVRQY
jgi:3-deoxy-manno-octulosonate cytidylyltransferase (CMP-KDO synthetase)